MSTAPPPPAHQQHYGPGMPPVPVPNPELIVYLLALLVVGLVALVDDETVSGGTWVDFAKWATAAYLVSRGIAKLHNVTESR